MNGETCDLALPSLAAADFGASCGGDSIEAIVEGGSGRGVFWCGSVFDRVCSLCVFFSSPSLNKEMCGLGFALGCCGCNSQFQSVLFCACIFQGVSGAGVFADAVACSADFGDRGGCG